MSYDYFELEAALSYRDAVRVSVAWSPHAAYVTHDAGLQMADRSPPEIALRQPLAHWLSLVAGIGYRDIERASTSGYGYWNAGLTAQEARLPSISRATAGRGRA